MSHAFLPPRHPQFQHTGFVGCQHRQADGSCSPVLRTQLLAVCPVLVVGALSVHRAIGLAPFLTMVVVRFFTVLLCIAAVTWSFRMAFCDTLGPLLLPEPQPGPSSCLAGSGPSVEHKWTWVGCVINPIGQTFLGYCDLSMGI